jgi:precorrin-6B methylase 2
MPPASLVSFARLGLDFNGTDRPTALAGLHLHWLFQILRGQTVRQSLEVGFGLGISAAALFHAGVEAHIAIEISKARLPVAEANVAKVRQAHQQFRLLQGRSDRWLPALVEEGAAVDLLLIDGGHRFDDVFIDVHYAQKLIRPGGIMLLDDCGLSGVRAVTSWLDSNLGHLWEKLPPPRELCLQPGFAMAAYRRADVKDDARPDGNRPWNRHRRFETFDDQN